LYAYDPSEWTDLFVATAGAAAALAGLLFVAISINLERIIGEAGLPERALEAVLLLIGVLVVAIVCLIPGQSQGVLGVELFLVTGVLAFAILRPIRGMPKDAPRGWIISRWALRLTGTVPLLIGAISVMIGDGGGLYWVVAGIVFATLAGVANAWVLLIEILR
jgi:modulator of FtsH protease